MRKLLNQSLSKERENRVFFLGGVVLLILLAVRQLSLVNRYAVNLMIWDQWTIYDPQFNGGGWWDAFDFQHGPHRQGVGSLLIYGLAYIGDWNSRWDAFAVSGTLIIATIVALCLAWKCGARRLQLVVVPLFYLNIRQYEGLVHASNVSHGAMPVLLLTLLSLCWFIQCMAKRYVCISILTFTLIFTGFGLFAGLLTPLILVVDIYHSYTNNKKADGRYGVYALAAIAVFWLLFLHDYHFSPAASEFRFPHERPWEYLYFVALMLSNFCGLAGHSFVSVAIGSVFAGLITYVATVHGIRILRATNKTEIDRVIFYLATFTLIFCIETSIGRVCLGWESASRASRYVTLMIPGGMAILLHFSTLRSIRSARWSTLAYGLLLLWGTLFLRPGDWQLITQWSTGRKTWKDTYLATHNEQTANEVSRFPIYPGPLPEAHLRYLEEHHLNLFNGAPP
jgi:hypothetical protein